MYDHEPDWFLRVGPPVDSFVHKDLGIVTVLHVFPSGARIVEDCSGKHWLLERYLPPYRNGQVVANA